VPPQAPLTPSDILLRNWSNNGFSGSLENEINHTQSGDSQHANTDSSYQFADATDVVNGELEPSKLALADVVQKTKAVSTYLFDSGSGFWVVDDTGAASVDGLIGSADAAEIVFDDERRVA
jgi:hypothetical protein